MPNKRGGQNKRGGWKISKILINGGDPISGGVGISTIENTKIGQE